MLRKRISLQMNGLNKLKEEYLKKIEEVIDNSAIELTELNRKARVDRFTSNNQINAKVSLKKHAEKILLFQLKKNSVISEYEKACKKVLKDFILLLKIIEQRVQIRQNGNIFEIDKSLTTTSNSDGISFKKNYQRINSTKENNYVNYNKKEVSILKESWKHAHPCKL